MFAYRSQPGLLALAVAIVALAIPVVAVVVPVAIVGAAALPVASILMMALRG